MSLALRSIGKDLDAFLSLSQDTYINKVLDRFNMKNCSPSVAPILKGDRFDLN